MHQTCQELTAMLPTTLESETTKGISVALYSIVSAAGFVIDCTRMPKQAIVTTLNSSTICKEVVSLIKCIQPQN